jgi:uncharacterized protein YbjT (DUF2867 family)
MTTTLVTGASGQIGSTLARLLSDQGQTVRRATSRTPSQPAEVKVNLATDEGLAAALAGVDQLFLMAPPGYANQHELLIPAIDAAKAARVRKVLLLSAMGANADDSIPLRRAELHLERSGLAWNVIRPNWFMQNFHTFWLHGIQTQGQIFLPVGERQGQLHRHRDIAAVAARLLSSDDFVNEAHDLTGSEALDHTQVAAILSKAAGRPIGYTDIPEDAMRHTQHLFRRGRGVHRLGPPPACATASRSASNTLMASMNGGSPTALLPCTLSSRLASGQRSTLKCAGMSPVAGIL